VGREISTCLGEYNACLGQPWRTVRCTGRCRSTQTFLAGTAPEAHACLILDVHLPGMSTFELLDRLRASAPPRPAVFITAQDEPRSRQRAARMAESAYLRKPFAGAALLEALRSLLGRSGASAGSPGA
jgi:DNA-binding response OmpR family regulator